jgi:ABC-type glycerol-3-phosphate transport system substrate-binding protein
MSDLTAPRLSRRRLIWYGAAFAATAPLAACGAPAPAPTAPPAAPTTPAPTAAAKAAAPTTAPAAAPTTAPAAAPTTAAAATAPAKAAAPVELQITNVTHGGADGHKALFPVGYGVFSQKRNGQVTVKETLLPTDAQYYVKILTAIAGGTPPDAAYLHPQEGLPAFASQKVIVPIDDYVKSDPTVNIADFNPGPLSYYQYPQGSAAKLYGLPWYYGSAIMQVNKKVFQKHGVETPDQLEKAGRWTWESHLEISQKLTQGSGAEKTFGYDGISSALNWLIAVIWGYGGDLWDAGMDKTLLGDSPTAEALDFYASFQYKHKVVPTAAEQEGLAGGFLAGRTAMRFGTKGNVPEMLGAAAQGKVDPGIAPMPKGPKGRFTRGGSTSLTILAATKHKDEAWQLINFMTQKEFQDIQNATGRALPARKSLWADFAKTLQPWEDINIYQEASQVEKAPPITTTQLDIQAAFGAEYDLVKLGQQSYKDAAAKFVPKINALLQKAKAG